MIARSVAFGAMLLVPGLWFVDRVIFGLVQRFPDSFRFILSPWVAPALILAAMAVLFGTAALLAFGGRDGQQ